MKIWEIHDTLHAHPEFDNHKVFAFGVPHYGLIGFFGIHRMIESTIAQHNCNVPFLASGGTRLFPYANVNDAVTDVLRLSKGMTYKAVLAGIESGGGKAVIIGDPYSVKTADFLRTYGRFVRNVNEQILQPQFNGMFMTGEDSGITEKDADKIATEAKQYIFGVSSGAGDPSPLTAIGVVEGIKKCLEVVYGDADICKRSFAIQGIGNVGQRVAEMLYKMGGTLYATDIDRNKRLQFWIENFGAVPSPEGIHMLNVDVFVPCALGAILNSKTIPELQCKIVAGSANNQLATKEDAAKLNGRGILYAPDFVINAGGLIHVAHECSLSGYNAHKAIAHVKTIPDTLGAIFAKSKIENSTTHEAAVRMADEILQTKNMAWK